MKKRSSSLLPWVGSALIVLAGLYIAVSVSADRSLDDVQAALDALKPMTALYVGGMGHEKKNFHKDQMARRGFPEAAARIQELFLAGLREEAVAAVPDEYLDQGCLIGPKERIRERWRKQWEPMPYTGVTVRARQDEGYELMADLVGTRDR